MLGAGGVLGGAWLTGALNALAARTRWDPGSADQIVGTSAGSMIGALVASGVPPWFMVAHSRGEVFDGITGPDGRPAADADRSGGAGFRLHLGLPQIGPGSLRMAARTLSNPLRHTPLQLVAGWLPVGLVSTDSLKDIVRRAVNEPWVGHPSFWAVACDYGSGRRVPFGRLGSPNAELADAVAASCAIPGFYRPVSIGGRRYVDGGVCSSSNLDLVAGRGLDLVICLNPMTSPAGAVGAIDALPLVGRGAGRRRLGQEATKLRRFGTRLALIEPTREDLEAMGRNWMSAARRQEVIETAERTTRAQLDRPELVAALAGLPEGEPHKVERPPGPPASWPELRPAAPRRAAA